MNPELRKTIINLPSNPGVYRYYDVDGQILYIGKARNLKKRVSSYFVNRAELSSRIRVMVSKIHSLEYTIVHSEYDALLLENNLIKKYQPRYNINLRDDKTYPYIVVRKEDFPRVYSTRRLNAVPGDYFGPYANVGIMRSILDLLRKLFHTRSCNLPLTEESISKGKWKVCLDYYIKICKGPCQAYQTKIDYNDNIAQLKNFLKGDYQEVYKYLNYFLNTYIEQLEFEKAQEIKDKLDLLEKFQAKSTVVSPTIGELDVFSFYSTEKSVFINYMHVKNGSIINTDTIEIKRKMDESDEEILLYTIVEMRQKYQSSAKEIILPYLILTQIEGAKYHIPKLGDKKKVYELSKKNAFQYFQDRLKSKELNKDRRRNFSLLQEAQKDLNLKTPPYHIECFDNSNMQGSYPVASVVVFKNGVPSKKDYRAFDVKTVVGPDDFATMEESVYRRYKRMLDEGTELPNLIIIDGGKGQLSSAVSSLISLGIHDKVDIIGIAKRLEEIYKPGDPLPLYINKKSQTLKLIQRARDEAHRNGITAHRKKRNKGTLKTELTIIEGIGPATSEKLLTHFRSIKKIKEAAHDEIISIVGKAKAQVVFDWVNNQAESNKKQDK
jgi:excinuclease ABC subunit C